MKRHLLLSTVLLLAIVWTSNEATAQQPGVTYIYPNGTTGYYLGTYRSNYYRVPPVTSGFYAPPAYNVVPQRGYPYYTGRDSMRNNYYLNYPGFYYQQNGYGMPR